MEAKIDWEPNEDDYGVLWKYLQDDNITDIDYSSNILWITDLEKGRYGIEEHGITNSFLDKFTHQIANRANKQFNKQKPILETQTNELRITIVHESRALSGRCICIRKSKREIRMKKETMISTGYCNIHAMNLLINCVRAKMNIAFCGEPGVGKTECAKFFMQYIPLNERIITIENTAEIHIGEINPGCDHVELIVDEDEFGEFDYTAAIKTCLRLNPKWIMLSEARSTEVKFLLEQWSTGVHGFTTLHLDDLSKLSSRIINMHGNSKDDRRLENDVYEFVNLGVLIRKKIVNKKAVRYIDQLTFYYREDNINKMSYIIKYGSFTGEAIPEEIVRKFSFANIDRDKIFTYSEEL